MKELCKKSGMAVYHHIKDRNDYYLLVEEGINGVIQSVSVWNPNTCGLINRVNLEYMNFHSLDYLDVLLDNVLAERFYTS